MEETLALVSDERVENLLELLTAAVCIECKTWERSDCLAKETCLEL